MAPAPPLETIPDRSRPRAQADTSPRPRWLEGLNERQRRAVEHRGSHLLVIAGAGTGKTRTLAARAAGLLADGVRPDRLLLLTFTRRAAQEMLARATALAAGIPTAKITGGTFHSVANRLLRQHARALGLYDGFTVMDEGDAADRLSASRRDVIENITAGSRFPKASTLASIMSRVANAQLPLSQVLRDDFPWCADHADGIRLVFGAYGQRKRDDNVVDFDDLLLSWRALMADPQAGERLRGRWDHILVDEYQDVNAIQADIVHALGTPQDGEAATITAVGDDAQAIYGFRASSPEHILDFTTRHEGAQVVTLDRSYRCTPEVLKLANAIQSQADRQHPKELWTERAEGIRPRLVTTYDETAQSQWVCDAILDARERGMSLREQAVLYRTGTHANALEMALAQRNIPFVKFGGLKFLERAHVKDLHAMLRLLDNPGDRLAWHRVLRLAEGIGPSWENRLTETLGVGLWSPQDGPATSPLRRFVDTTIDVPTAATEFFAALRAAWRKSLGQEGDQPPPDVQLDALRSACEIAWPRVYLDFDARLADVDRLAAAASAHRTRGRFLSELTLDPPTSTGDLAGAPHLDDDWLTLSTIHSAKGLEWRSVHVIHAADGNLPSDMALRDKEGVEEERRLAYVAVTRARDELTVTVPLRYHKADNGWGDQHSYAQVSRYLRPLTHLFEQSSPGVPEAAETKVDPAIDRPVAALLEDLWAR